MDENHEEYWEMISAALDGELPAPDRAALDRHLAQCPACAALFEELAAQSSALRSLDCTPPEDLNLRIWRAICPQQNLQEPPAPTPISAPSRSASRALRPMELASPANFPNDQQSDKGDGISAPKPSSRKSRGLWAALAALAACAVLMVGLRLPGLFQSIANTSAGGDLLGASLPEDEPMPYSGSDPAEPYSAADEPVEPISGLARGIPLPEPTAAPDTESDAGTDTETGTETGTGTGTDTDTGTAPAPARLPFGFDGTAADPGASIPFENPQVLRVSWSYTPVSDCAWVFSSAEELEDFLDKFSMDDLSSLLEQYDSTFFAQHQLAAAVVESGSGSVAYSIPQNGLTADCLTISCKIPEIGTCDMAAWLLTAEVAAGTLPAGNTLPIDIIPN